MTSKIFDENAILDAAAEIFAEKGFAGARVDEIASIAGVNKAMLYYRVGDKEELYRRVVLRGQQGFRNTMMKALETSTDATETMESIIEGITENAVENRLIPSIILRELAGRAATLPEEGLEGIKGFMEIVRSVVNMGMEEGAFREVDPVALQFMVVASVFTLSLTTEMRQSLNPASPGPLTSGEIASALLDILAHGIIRKGK